MWVDLAGDHGDVRIHCREYGSGETTLLYLHGGWGYSIYPFERQLDQLVARFRVLIPDRTGYGLSGRRHEAFPLDFHRRAASETLALMDALEMERAMLWGHSDGACIAAWMGLDAPERCQALVLEALHLRRSKPRSREFFETMATDPTLFGERVSQTLSQEHGEGYWQELLRMGGEVWLAIGETAKTSADLFDGRLSELEPPALLLHGAEDPRTEPGELEQARAALPSAELGVIEAARHCPHAERQVWRQATALAVDFLLRNAPAGK